MPGATGPTPPVNARRGYLIVGPESSGSVFISRVISRVVGACEHFGQWNGHGFHASADGRILLLHRSLPYQRPKRFDTAEQLLAPFTGCDTLKVVLCTRDPTISLLSKQRRFGDDPAAEGAADLARAVPVFAELLRRADSLIWSYETMLLLGNEAFALLYDWLGVESSFLPDVIDANRAYLRDPPGRDAEKATD